MRSEELVDEKCLEWYLSEGGEIVGCPVCLF